MRAHDPYCSTLCGTDCPSLSAFKGKIYCSDITRRLLIMKFPEMPPRSIVALELNVPHAIRMPPAASLVTLTLVDANHCPGAVVLHARCAAQRRAPSSLVLFSHAARGSLSWGAIVFCGDCRVNDILCRCLEGGRGEEGGACFCTKSHQPIHTPRQ